MSFPVSVTLCPVSHPRLHTAIFPIKKRSRAEVIRRYAEIGLLFEMGMLNINTTGNKGAQTTINAISNPSIKEDNYDNEIIDIFGMIDDDADKDDE